VQLSGTVVRRASLHNADIIEKLDLYIGDTVYVEKGGEIIPKITGVDLDMRLLVGDKVRFIERCPECGTPLVRVDGEAAYYCPNDTACPPQLKGRIAHFVSREAMNIDSIGPETIEQIFGLGLINNAADLYSIDVSDLMFLPRMGVKSAENMISGIHSSLEIPFERVLYALGIRYVGVTVAKRLAHAFYNIDALMQATVEQLVAVDDIGERIAGSVYLYFQNEKSLAI
jgi:DNA ligase (NAD+)